MNATEERAEEARPSPKKRFPVSSVLPIVALGLSVFSVYFSDLARRDVGRMEVIKTEYGLLHDLAQIQLQYPVMAHLFTATAQAYDANVAEIKVSVGSLSEQERAKMLLQERAVVHYLFTTYEETFYVWGQAKEADDKRRAQLAEDDLRYFNAALCSNPRLQWYWDFKGGKLDREFAGELRSYYRENVLKSCTTVKDSAGPFGH
jgi:hypothetical protein